MGVPGSGGLNFLSVVTEIFLFVKFFSRLHIGFYYFDISARNRCYMYYCWNLICFPLWVR